ncbi:MAG TPA: indolepyruvate oxidoreductase subunit beta [Methanothrix sp.]|jgi:indolepyruvate ferredoxin oxidoreductase beta subunit|uniref:indolepyruvate oxidoreductase subunit beta n=2 Tax=Methanothrix sp. TaxID=90426 RepID=UPI001BD3FBD3|nr:indolepyruvate oxidoreductase subunit beta [Methanothrix sp.]MDI9416838.1 indolepyruvate oxidoreductase subunit beta [Euryarchaeota archaeon]HON35683.1 indolepyruvate oxidoreductase subunit beta [Methanothrix sp.]HRU75934.1 indolepyruvate oxidoreductase subunit beta [Methanothrix sp.]
MRSSECDMVIVGVGGQGVILISDVIGRAGVLAGKPVRGAETHGMAQRGGSVVNHTRIGCRYSPMVAPGNADLLVALEPAEALRSGHFLSPRGVALVNTQPVLPVTVTTGEARYPSLEELLRPLEEQCQRVLAIEATALAEKAGTVQAMNVVMLGALSGYIPLSEKHIIQALERVVPPRHLESNKRAFLLGKAEVE